MELIGILWGRKHNLVDAQGRALAPILPEKFHVNPASVIAASLPDSVLIARAGCRWIFAEELN
jgi:hypothetical protein